MLAGSEGIRTAIEQDRVLGLTNAALPADQPLPPAADVAPLEFPRPPPGPDGKPAQEPKIEPIARHVPAEFFYIRFGSFDNFLWFQDTLDTWGGDLQNLVAMRGLNDQKNQRIQNQLVLEQTQLSRMLGGTVISDVAMVGTDLLMQDGAAIGFLFEARNGMLLGSSLSGPRAARVKARQGQGGNGQDRGAERLLSFLARRLDPFLLRGQRRLPLRDLLAGPGGPLPANGQGRGLAGQFAGIPPCPQRAADRSQRRRVRLFFRRLLPQLHEPRLPHRVASPPGGRHRHRDRATGEAQRGHGRQAGRHDRGTDRRRVPAARLRPAARRQPGRDRQGRGLRFASRPAGFLRPRARRAGSASQRGGGRFLRPLRGLRPGELGPGRADARRPAAQSALPGKQRAEW